MLQRHATVSASIYHRAVLSKRRAAIFLAVEGMRRGEAAVHDQGMAVDVAGLVRGEEEGGGRPLPIRSSSTGRFDLPSDAGRPPDA